VFSDSQQAITYASLGVSLATKSPFRLFMMNEMTPLHPTNRRKLAESITKLVTNGELDQFIGLDHDETPYLGIEGLTIVHV
jgi:hypothetical protein